MSDSTAGGGWQISTERQGHVVVLTIMADPGRGSELVRLRLLLNLADAEQVAALIEQAAGSGYHRSQAP